MPYNRYFLPALLLTLLFLVFTGTLPAQPPAPADLIVTQVMGNARLDWSAASGALGYHVYKSVDAAPFLPIAVVSISRFIDHFVPPGSVYRYYVTAFNADGEGPPSNEVTFVPDIPPPPAVHGFVTGEVLDDSTGLPVCGVRIRFYTPAGTMYYREAKTDTMGRYFAPLDTGTYLIYATKWTYVPEWYDDAAARESATLMSVTRHDTSTADFGLTRIPPPEPPRLVTVSGTVVDSLTGDPMKGAWVAILRTHRQLALMQNYEGGLYGARNESVTIPGLGTMLGIVRLARTDSLGRYSLLVPDSLTYILLGYQPGYVLEFYKDKRTPYEADRVPVLGGATGIDFNLVQDPLAGNSIAGTVSNQDGFGVRSRVILFTATERGPYPVRFTLSDTLGAYGFQHVYPGTYYLKAVPVLPYAPAWHDADSCGTPCWVYADTFQVSGVVAGIDVCVKPILLPGFASIGGAVTGEPTGDAVQGATVYALSVSTGAVAGYDITEADGSYSIGGIAPGSYTLVVDREGYLEARSAAGVDALNNYAVADADIGLESVMTSVDESGGAVTATYTISQNYPNPFNPSTEITFGVPATARVTLGVYNVLGQRVAILADRTFEPGTYSVRWHATDEVGTPVPSGLYFYRMNAHDATGNVVVSVRKMLLVR